MLFRSSAVLATLPSFKATVKVVNLAVRSKVLINFLFDFGVFAHWPMALKSTKCEVEVVMGPFKCVFLPPHIQDPPADVYLVARRTFTCLSPNTSHKLPKTNSTVASWMQLRRPSRVHDRDGRDIVMTIYILYRYNRSY